MPAPRLPTKTLELRGAFARNPKRRAARKAEPTPAGELGPPPRLSKKQRAAWDEIVAQAAPGVLTSADRLIVELTARLAARMRDGELNGFLAQQLRSCLASLAMTPADRSRVNVPPPPPPPKSGWEAFDDGPKN